MKTSILVKTTVAAAFLVGAFCQAAVGDTTDLWNHNCSVCHGKDGKGATMMGRRLQIKDLTDPKVQAALTDADAMKIIKEGITEDGKVKMKPYANKLTDDEIKTLADFVRSFKGK